MTGSQMVVECLKEQNVDTIFGYQGGAVIPLYDALYDEQENFKIIRPAHEQNAVHAADSYARTTGKTGVCIVTSGPGATNTVTGIANAYMDSVPIVVITGQVATSLLGKDSFQEIDITGITAPITKYNVLVRDIDQLPEALSKAFKIAKDGRPGPVLVDIAKDVLMGKAKFVSRYEKETKTCVPGEDTEEKALNIARLINESEKPVIYAGGGVKTSRAQDILLDLAEKNSIPVVNTLMGLGSIPRNNRLSLGLVGMHGSKEANLAVTKSDLIIAIGARFSDRVIGKKDRFAPGAKIVHIDIDEAEIGKNMQVYYSHVCDLKESLESMVDHVESNDRKSWIDEIETWKVDDGIKESDFAAKNIIGAISSKFSGDPIVVTDVGQHQMWTAQYWKFNGKTDFVTSGGLGTMGFGMGAAYGAKTGNPDRNVILFVGDGGFRMSCQELVTISKYKIPVLIVLMNNSTLGMVRQWQKLFSNKRYMETDIGDDVDYIKLAETYRIKGVQVKDMESLKQFLDSFEDITEPMLVECKLSKDDNVLPIVPPGVAIDELIVKTY
ncbi:biosynthetic-type acetolactate synthase large subunit [Alkalibacter mobilis]|uniref:biosynthetic-type acetolactate synthase large subunit n=1 Tax=Alkalibacter mobilis TaxID=2787712 RepID=UPI0018A0D3C4|nr:biosynthetic-type acetolactate synthase large subunit [Alkalibacter mobilis]MBF7096693.1 biosynthetic-type acetolactate synthase large subunit [Alkalibacter mobilis]